MMITHMKAEHVTQVAELEKICFVDPWDKASIASELNNKLSLWLVAEVDGNVAGYVGSQTVIDETDMMNIAVHPDYRRRGIAKDLIAALIAELKKNGSHCLILEVRESNDSARKLYETQDFIQVGLRKNYYRHPKENAIILRKEWEL